MEAVTDEAETFDFKITKLVFCFSVGDAVVLPVEKDAGALLKIFADVLSDERIGKVGHNIKGSVLALKKYGIHMRGQLFDTIDVSLKSRQTLLVDAIKTLIAFHLQPQ